MRYYPDKKEFLKLAKKGNLIPVYREIMADFETPVSAFAKIEKGNYSFFLESVEGGERIARYSFLGSDPSLVLSTKGKRVQLREGNITRRFKTDTGPLGELRKILARYKFVNVKGLPRFCGGLVGFFGYDTVRFIEDTPDKNPDDLKIPDSVFMLTDTLVIFDHVDHKLKVVSNCHVKGDPSQSYEEATRKIEELIRRVKFADKPRNAEFLPFSLKKKTKHLKVGSNFTRNAFMASVRRAKGYIRKGDAIQVVLSQRFEVPVRSNSFEIYRALRSINPSPYMFYLSFPGFKLIGSSPEIMVRCEDRVVELRPIAGTRPRGKTEIEDGKLARELLRDPKEKAEHIMLVDLGRNDVGKVCDFKSIEVSELMAIEKYSHVMHIVSDVRGRLKKNKDIFDAMTIFPEGSFLQTFSRFGQDPMSIHGKSPSRHSAFLDFCNTA
ncbi:anthranilate synthase component I family protein [Candidatus Omnitrophota bacterium]